MVLLSKVDDDTIQTAIGSETMPTIGARGYNLGPKRTKVGPRVEALWEILFRRTFEEYL